MNWPVICITLITYNRKKEFWQTLKSAQDKIIYEPNRLLWIISDDGSDEDYLPNRAANVIILRNENRAGGAGMPVNWNRALSLSMEHSDYALCLQDDWLFTSPLDLRMAVLFLQHNPDYGMLRYHKLTGHVGLPMVVKEWDMRSAISAGYPIRENEYAQHMLPFLELIPPFDLSDTYSPYSGGVHLRHHDFTRFYGQYPVGARFSQAEMEYFARVNQSLRFNLQAGVRHRVAIFPQYILSQFRDLCIGNSYRDTAVEHETLSHDA